MPDFTETSEPGSRPKVIAQISNNQEVPGIPEGMVIQKNMPNLLALLETHVGGASPMVTMDSRPLTPLLAWTSHFEPMENKRERDKKIGK